MLRKSSVMFRRKCRSSSLMQILVIMSFWFLGEAVVRFTGLPVPGGIVGLFILTLMLIFEVISVRSVKLGARWFIGEMLLFFVPAVLVVLNHPELAGILGLKILTVVAFGTAVIMIVTAFFVEFSYLYMIRRKRRA